MEALARESWSFEMYRAERTELQYMCDLCDRKTPFKDIHRTTEHVYLCTCCHQYINAVPEGKIKHSIIRFLERNVI